MSRHALRRLILTATLGLALQGCGSTVRARDGELRIGVTEYRVRPSRLSAVAGRLVLKVTNFGRLTHDLAIAAGSRIIASTPPIPPSATATLVVRLPPGNYTVESTVSSDDSLGTYGTLYVSKGIRAPAAN